MKPGLRLEPGPSPEPALAPAPRTQLAQAAQVPAYLVFSNATLADMATKSPSTIEEFMEVSGVGQVKAARMMTFSPWNSTWSAWGPGRRVS